MYRVSMSVQDGQRMLLSKIFALPDDISMAQLYESVCSPLCMQCHDQGKAGKTRAPNNVAPTTKSHKRSINSL